MEVTNVSSSPTSPSEGPDLCETDVTNVAIHIVSLIICLCGLAGNWAVLCLLKSKITIYRIFDVAVTDFFFLLFIAPASLLLLVEDVSCSPLVPLLYLSFLFQLSLLSFYRVLFRLVPTSISYYIDKLLHLCCRRKLSLRLHMVLTIAQDWTFYVLFTLIPTMTFLCPSHKQVHCRIIIISMYTIFLLLFAAPMLISSTIFFIKAKWGSQQQQPRRLDIIIFIIVLFTLLLNLCNFLQELSYIIVPSQVVFLLICIHSSIKPFIYFMVGRCGTPCSMESLRLSLQRVFEEQKNNRAYRDDTGQDTGLNLLIISTALLKVPGTVAEGFLESPD